VGKAKSLDAKGAKLVKFRKVEQATAKEEADPYGMTARKTRATATTTTGVLHCVQDDGVKQTTTKTTAG
jgi:hypothetical protein